MDVDNLLKKHGIAKGKIDIKEVFDLLRRREQIAAVQLVLHQSGAGLRVTKELCDDLQKEMQ